MQLSKLLTEVENQTAVKRVYVVILVLSMVLNLVLVLSAVMYDKSARTQLIPPEVRRSFWVDGRNLDAVYLEEMGDYIVQKFATFTPATVERQHAQILKFVEPTVYGELSVMWKAADTKVKQDQVTQVFHPREVRVAPETSRVAMIGYLDTWIGDKKLGTSPLKAYVTQFKFNGSATLVSSVKEADAANPFGVGVKGDKE
jgi:conjugal transfer pilus assembly protein TraE